MVELTGSADGPAYRKASEAIRLKHMASVQKQIANQAKYNESVRRAVNAEALGGVAPEESEMDSITIDSPITTTNNYTQKGTAPIAKVAIAAGLVAAGAALPAIVGVALSMGGKSVPDRPEPAEAVQYMLDLGD